jgi:hypothetical protein
MIHYAVVVDGKVIGSRSSKSHAVQIYTHALVAAEQGKAGTVLSYHSSERLAESARGQWRVNVSRWAAQGDVEPMRFSSVVPVAVTLKRAKVGQTAEQLLGADRPLTAAELADVEEVARG